MSEKENKTIIFVETKRRCDELTRRMRRDGYVSSFGGRRGGFAAPWCPFLFSTLQSLLRRSTLMVSGSFCFLSVLLLKSNLSVTDGQQWEFMETRASRSGTGSLMVRYRRSLWRFQQVLMPVETGADADRCFACHLSEFRYGKAPILIATDVASRGLGQYSVRGTRWLSVLKIF